MLELVDFVPLKYDRWNKHLTNHPDALFRKTILDIVLYGAKIGYTGPDQCFLGKNLASTTKACGVRTQTDKPGK